MPRRHPEARSARPGGRVSVRRVRPDGDTGDIVGWVLRSDPDRLVLRDRRGSVHDLRWEDVLAWRPVGVPRGRDPLRTSRDELDRHALPGSGGRVFVARLSSLLDGRTPAILDDPGDPPPFPAALSGEWVSAGEAGDYVALAWWAAHHDARSMQVRTPTPSRIEQLRVLGFVELP